MKETKTKQVQEPVTPTIADEIDLLRGFRDMMHERYGFNAARRLKQQEMNKAVEETAKKLRESKKTERQAIEDYLEKPTEPIKTKIAETRKTIKAQSTAVADGRKPFKETISNLSKGVRYIDSVAAPDSLKELGKPIVPMFSLADWVKKALESQKKK
jgi:CheY-like chemotaxis protein